MLKCPNCNIKIILRALPHQGFCKSDRVCPECNGHFMVDKETKRRQVLLMIILLISLVLTLLLYFDGTKWLTPALSSYTALVLLTCWANRKVFLVPCESGLEHKGDS